LTNCSLKHSDVLVYHLKEQRKDASLDLEAGSCWNNGGRPFQAAGAAYESGRYANGVKNDVICINKTYNIYVAEYLFVPKHSVWNFVEV